MDPGRQFSLSARSASLRGCGGAAAHHDTTTAAADVAAHARGLLGLVPQPLPRKPAFVLTDTSGEPYALARETRGRLTYLYFGYTHCPDACPATMSDLSYALRLQPPAIRRQITVVFVTVDPRRDTLAVLRTWIDHYSRTCLGLRGTPP